LFQGVQESGKTSMKAEELVEILKGDGDQKEKDVAQSAVVSEEVTVLAITLSCRFPCLLRQKSDLQSGRRLCSSRSVVKIPWLVDIEFSIDHEQC